MTDTLTIIALTLFALCLAPIVLVETTIAVFNHYQRKREEKDIYKPLKH